MKSLLNKKNKYTLEIRRSCLKNLINTSRKQLCQKNSEQEEIMLKESQIKTFLDNKKYLLKEFEIVKISNLYHIKKLNNFLAELENFNISLLRKQLSKLDYEISIHIIFFNLLDLLKESQLLDISDSIYDALIYLSYYFNIKLNEIKIEVFLNKLKAIENPFLFCGKLSYSINNVFQANKKHLLMFETPLYNLFLNIFKEKISRENFSMALKNFNLILDDAHMVKYLNDDLKEISSILINFYIKRINFIEIIPILSKIENLSEVENYESFLNALFEVFSEEQNEIHDCHSLIVLKNLFTKGKNFEHIFLLNYNVTLKKIFLLLEINDIDKEVCCELFNVIFDRYGFSLFENLNLDFLSLVLRVLFKNETEDECIFFFCLNFFTFFDYKNFDNEKLFAIVERLSNNFLHSQFQNQKLILKIIDQICDKLSECDFSQFYKFAEKMKENKSFILIFDIDKNSLFDESLYYLLEEIYEKVVEN